MRTTSWTKSWTSELGDVRLSLREAPVARIRRYPAKYSAHYMVQMRNGKQYKIVYRTVTIVVRREQDHSASESGVGEAYCRKKRQAVIGQLQYWHTRGGNAFDGPGRQRQQRPGCLSQHHDPHLAAPLSVHAYAIHVHSTSTVQESARKRSA